MSQLPSITPATNHRSQSSTTFDGSPPASDSDTSPPNNSNDASSAAVSSPSANEPRQYLPLNQRIPNTDAVLKVVRSKQKVNHMLEYSIFVNEEDRVVLFNEEFWQQVSVSIVNAISLCFTSNRKEVKKMSHKYRLMEKKIIETIGKHDVYDEGDTSKTEKQRLAASRTMMLIGWHYLHEFSKLIKSSWGDDIRSIHEQIDAELKSAFELSTGELFGDDTRLAEHAYYVVGFLNHAGMKEKERRTDKNDVGACIERACRHYLSADDPKLDELRETMPTGLVDRRIANGGLKYPDEPFFRVFGSMERAYAKIVTPDNFMARGGLLLDEIRDALERNEQLIAQFTLLLDGSEFTDEAIIKTLAYFIKVFSHLRAKDVALKYNSNLNGSNTVGLRQTLAGGLAMGTSNKKKASRKKKNNTTTSTAAATLNPNNTESKYQSKRVAELKEICRARGLTLSGLKQVLIDRLDEYDREKVATTKSNGEDGVDDSGEEEEEVDSEGEEDETMDEESQHSVMLSALNGIDSEIDDDYHSAEKISDRDLIADAIENDM